MSKHTHTYFRALLGLRTLSPLHAGVLGGNHIIDRPIDREINSGWPKVNSAALKGALREQGIARSGNAANLFGVEESVFEDENGKKQKVRYGKAGLLSFTDARLLLFPVRSARGGWAWVSCPAVLERFREEAGLAGYDVAQPAMKDFYAVFANKIDDDAILYAGNTLNLGDKLLLHHHIFGVDTRLDKSKLKDWQKAIPLLSDLDDFPERLAIVSDENFTELARLYTEVSTRNKIKDGTGATGGGALFTEEYLPEGALLYALSFSMPNATHNDVEDKLDTAPKVLQLAGNATLGKGRCALSWHFSSGSQKQEV
ncbi:MAG: type III-B CRISPR module RAMP protein Cmr4 [Phaeodactylibacter sp.]|uniref:type III-B CRISPR module RAMP protein Cmr4 n=1 Tax=Phaeodactylibacter sp. TaxID=1940289 RepID=UPI0032EFC3AD